MYPLIVGLTTFNMFASSLLTGGGGEGQVSTTSDGDDSNGDEGKCACM